MAWNQRGIVSVKLDQGDDGLLHVCTSSVPEVSALTTGFSNVADAERAIAKMLEDEKNGAHGQQLCWLRVTLLNTGKPAGMH